MHVVLQLPLHRFEGVADRHVHILVRTVDFQVLVPLLFVFVLHRRLVRDDEFLAGHSELDAEVQRVATPPMTVRCLDHHAAARDAVEILVELVRFLLDPRDHGLGMIHVSESCLHW